MKTKFRIDWRIKDTTIGKLFVGFWSLWFYSIISTILRFPENLIYVLITSTITYLLWDIYPYPHIERYYITKQPKINLRKLVERIKRNDKV